MHELSIAMNIVEIVEEEAHKAQATEVCEVVLQIGSLSGILPDALEFALPEAVRGGMLEKTLFTLEIVIAVAVCEECCNEFELQDHVKICPFCNSLNTYFLTGKELKIKSIVITQPEPKQSCAEPADAVKNPR